MTCAKLCNEKYITKLNLELTKRQTKMCLFWRKSTVQIKVYHILFNEATLYLSGFLQSIYKINPSLANQAMRDIFTM